ncbi:uncharacterized protein METZ01_LOCUS380336, partial [marine metagenome]
EVFAEDIEFIRAMIHYEIDEALFSVEEARRNLFNADPQTQLAGTLFQEAELLLDGSKRQSVVASR